MLSAKLSPHLMPVVFVMTTARRTRSLCVHLTRQHSRTSASVCWTFANAKVITPSTIQAAVQVRFPVYQERVNCLCRAKNVQANKKHVAAIGTERTILCPFSGALARTKHVQRNTMGNKIWSSILACENIWKSFDHSPVHLSVHRGVRPHHRETSVKCHFLASETICNLCWTEFKTFKLSLIESPQNRVATEGYLITVSWAQITTLLGHSCC